MTTEAVVHPRILEASAQLQKRLVELENETAEIVLSARIVVRSGVPRKIKWTREDEQCYS